MRLFSAGFEDAEEMDAFLDTPDFPKLTQEKKEKPESTEETGSVI